MDSLKKAPMLLFKGGVGNGPKRILLVGCGAFARQSHLPALREAGGRVQLAGVVDYREREDDVRAACIRAGLRDVPFVHLPGSDRAVDHHALDALAARVPEVHAVIVSSPEATHKDYTSWALGRGLPTLVDKPLTVRHTVRGTLSAPEVLVQDWRELRALARGVAPFMIAAQRRYQPIYREIAAIVRGEYLRSGYGPTFVQCLTNDGLWHAPADYPVQNTYQNGAGKLIHTGYHVLDIVPWLMRHAQGPERPGAAIARIRTATVFASTFRPEDAAVARTDADGRPSDLEDRCAFTQTLGEVNAAIQIVVRDDRGRTVCLVQIGTLHEGLSLNDISSAATPEERRARADAGRTKQDVLSMYMGPMSAVWLRRFAKLTRSEGTRLGDRDHLELVHARNPQADGAPALIESHTLTYRADDHAPTAEFLQALDDPARPVISPVDDHAIAVKLLSAAYASAGSTAVQVDFDPEEWALPPGS